MMVKLSVYCLLLLLVFGCHSVPNSRQALLAQEMLSMEQILLTVADDYAGQVTKAELDILDQRYVWKLIISAVDGATQQLVYDAISGTLLHAQTRS